MNADPIESPNLDEGNVSPVSPPSGGKRWLIVFAKLALTVLVTIGIFRAVGLGREDLSAFSFSSFDLNLPYLVLSILVLSCGYIISALLWGQMVYELGGPRLRGSVAVRVFMTANLGRYIPGKVWQLAGLALIGQRHGVRPAVGSAAAVLGQALGLIGALILGSMAILSRMDLTGNLAIIAPLAVLGLIAVVTSRRFLTMALSMWNRLTRTETADGVEFPQFFGVRWVAAYAINWSVYAAAFVVLLGGLGLHSVYLYAGSSFAAAYLIGYLSIFAPGGIGIREATLVYFLGPIFSPPVAFAIAGSARIWTTGVEILCLIPLLVRRGDSETSK